MEKLLTLEDAARRALQRIDERGEPSDVEQRLPLFGAPFPPDFRKMTSHWRGHSIFFEKGEWFYSDTRTPTVGEDRACGFCDRERTTEGHDGCLGVLPGVENACCGHGQDVDAYIQFKNGNHVQGKKAAERLPDLKRQLEEECK